MSILERIADFGFAQGPAASFVAAWAAKPAGCEGPRPTPGTRNTQRVRCLKGCLKHLLHHFLEPLLASLTAAQLGFQSLQTHKPNIVRKLLKPCSTSWFSKKPLGKPGPFYSIAASQHRSPPFVRFMARKRPLLDFETAAGDWDCVSVARPLGLWAFGPSGRFGGFWLTVGFIKSDGCLSLVGGRGEGSGNLSLPFPPAQSLGFWQLAFFGQRIRENRNSKSRFCDSIHFWDRRNRPTRSLPWRSRFAGVRGGWCATTGVCIARAGASRCCTRSLSWPLGLIHYFVCVCARVFRDWYPGRVAHFLHLTGQAFPVFSRNKSSKASPECLTHSYGSPRLVFHSRDRL